MPTGSRPGSRSALCAPPGASAPPGSRTQWIPWTSTATDDLWLRARHGNAAVRTPDGETDITADHGQIRIGTVSSTAVLQAPNGTIKIGGSGGDLDAKLSYGDLDIARAFASVAVRAHSLRQHPHTTRPEGRN